MLMTDVFLYNRKKNGKNLLDFYTEFFYTDVALIFSLQSNGKLKINPSQ